MANEGLIIDVDYNITKAEAKQNKLNRAMDVSRKKAANITKEIQSLNDEIDRSKMKEQEYSIEAEKIRNHLNQYEKNQLDLTDAQVKKERQQYDQLVRLIEKEQEQQRTKENSIAKQNLALRKQNNETANIGEQILLNNKKQNKFASSFEKSAKSADRFGRRLKSLIASALFFSLVTKAFTALRNEFGKLITETGTKTASLVAQLNGNLAVIGRTLYESARPAIEWILQALVKMTNILANGLAKILGKNVNEMKKLAKQTKKTGEEAKKATAGFDTLQTIDTSSNTSNDSGSAGTDFSALNDSIDSEVVLLMTILSGALLVLGVILAFSGLNIPLGIGLIAAGAIGLAASIIPNWNSLTENIKNTISLIMSIGGLLILVLGIILVCTGNLALGIPLIVLGAAGLVATVALNWNAIVEAIRGPIGVIMAILGASLLVLGIILLFTGAGLGIGLGLLLAGAASLGVSVGFNWNVITEKVKSIVSTIGKLFKNCWNGIKNGFKSMINGIISYANIWIDGLNLMLLPIRGLIVSIGKAFGSDIKLKDVKIPHIPKLATGAVLPGGSPMLAWVNDQPKGQPYVEGSIENIAAAFEKYLGDRSLGNQNITIEANGNWAQFIKFMNLEIKKESKRASIWG